MRADPLTNDPDERAPRFIERFPLATVHWTTGVAITIAMWLFSWWLRVALDSQLPPGFPFVTFFPVVIVASFAFGARIGTLSAILCGLTAWHEFTPPMNSWMLNRGGMVAMAFYGFITATDIAIIHFMQRSNRRLKAEREANAQLAQTRELLFRELQHRISNNLQMVAGLLALQRRQVSDAKAQAALDEAARRMGVVGRISRQLYDPNGESRSMSAFLRELTDDVVDASGRKGIDVSLAVEDDAPLPPDTAIPLALIVAETVSNSIEHGFEGRESGQINIRLSRSGKERIQLEVEDDGAGLPRGFDLDGTPSLGLKIAALLARQLGGGFALEPRAGASGALTRLDLPLAA